MLETVTQQDEGVRLHMNRLLSAVSCFCNGPLEQYFSLQIFFFNPPRWSHFYLSELVGGKKRREKKTTSPQIALIQSIDFSVKGAAVAPRALHID